MADKGTNNEADQLANLVNALIDERKEQPREQEENHREYIELEHLNLPPRSEVHKNPPFRLHINIKHPFVRFIVILIIVVGVLLGTYYFAGEQILAIFMS